MNVEKDSEEVSSKKSMDLKEEIFKLKKEKNAIITVLANVTKHIQIIIFLSCIPFPAISNTTNLITYLSSHARYDIVPRKPSPIITNHSYILYSDRRILQKNNKKATCNILPLYGIV